MSSPEPAPDAAAATPSQRYDAGAREGRWQNDPAQRAVLVALDRIHDKMLARERASGLSRWWSRVRHEDGVRGLYLWGGVGRGKTFLMDLLHDGLPPELCTRLHFHRFMGRVHAELQHHKHQRDPLMAVACHFAERPLLCLDEFFVQDIADAMILGELLRHLFAAGATLVTTSNIAPASLYGEGLQRAKFLPAVERLQRHCEIVELQSTVDYRLRALTHAPVYQTPLGEAAERALAEVFARLAPGSLRPEATMIVNDRPIALKKRADGIAWFDFSALCEGPRSVADYIEIARSYNTVLISDVPRFTRANDDAAKRFIHLVDEFYDRNVNLIVSAAEAPTTLYAGHYHGAEFARTASRLIEMSSAEYLAREHRG